MRYLSAESGIDVRAVIAGLMVGVLVLAACAPADVGVNETPTEPPAEEPTEASTEPPTGGEEVEVQMVDVAFEPEEVTVAAGTTVTWINEDAVQHTVTAGTRGDPTGMFDETVAGGGSFSFTFEEPGTYEYYCSFHPGMSGVVTVEE